MHDSLLSHSPLGFLPPWNVSALRDMQHGEAHGSIEGQKVASGNDISLALSHKTVISGLCKIAQRRPKPDSNNIITTSHPLSSMLIRSGLIEGASRDAMETVGHGGLATEGRGGWVRTNAAGEAYRSFLTTRLEHDQ